MKIVLDTNCLLSSISRRSPYRWLYELILSQELTLCVTTEILAEYEEQLSEFFSPSTADFVMKTILSLGNLQLTDVYYKWKIIKADPDDNKFVDCAIACNAMCIITHDRHFNILRKTGFPKVLHMKIEQFRVFYENFE